jgi:DNA repair photolyase
MEIIYETKGKAKEFAPLSANLYNGCSHGCTYCYSPQSLGTEKTCFHDNVKTAGNALDRFARDASLLKGKKDDREILLSFMTDPYQPIENDLLVTRQAIEILIRNNLRFTILTKGGTRAARDFVLLEGYAGCSFGTTLIFQSQQDSDLWEPGAASIYDRIIAIKQARERGIRTWVSIEPVIDPGQALGLIRSLHEYVDHWKIGKINYHPEIEEKTDWFAFRRDVSTLLEFLNKDYYLKKSLTDLETG